MSDRREQAATMRRAGLSAGVIGSALGVSPKTVRRWLAGAARPERVVGLDGRVYRPALLATTSDSLADRFWARVDQRGPDECWPWQGETDRFGYGVVTVGGDRRRHRAPRVAYALTHGMPSRRLAVHHECRQRLCCNPAHLRLLTPSAHSKLHAALRRKEREAA